MPNPSGEAKLYQPDVFQSFLNHEVNRSRRYGDSLTLVNLLVETEPLDNDAQQHADAFLAWALARHLRETDVLCQQEHEFLILMTSTSAPGARTACERMRKLIPTEEQTEIGLSFKLLAYIGMASMPVDHSISSSELAQHAALALMHARANHLLSAVAFTDIKL